MDWIFYAGLAVGALGAIAMNLGNGVQKMKVHVLTKGWAMFSREYRRDRRIWLMGVIGSTISAGLFSYAMNLTDKPSTISSLVGIGLIALVIFAWLVLKEKIGPREITGCAMVIIGTTVLAYFEVPIEDPASFVLVELITYIGIIMAAFALLVVYTLVTGNLHGVIFGCLAGTFIGIGLFIADIALVESGGSFLGQLKNPYPYVAMVAGVSALAVTQVGFLRARAVVVVPCQNSFTILIPLLLEYLVYTIHLSPPQYLGIVVLIPGVIVLSTTSAGARELGDIAGPHEDGKEKGTYEQSG
ncbi:MAG: EamA family transporter [bacterium]